MWWFIGIVLLFVFGISIGFLIASIMLNHRAAGSLKIDRSDPDGPYMFLELSENVDQIIRSDYITLKVDTKSYISRD